MTSSCRLSPREGRSLRPRLTRCQATATFATRWRLRHLRQTSSLRAHSERHKKIPPLQKTATAIGWPFSQSASQACSRCHARRLSNSQRGRVCSVTKRDWGGASASRPSTCLRGEALLRPPVGSRCCQSRRRAQSSVVTRKSCGRAFVVPGRGGQPRRPAAQVSPGARDRALCPPAPQRPRRRGLRLEGLFPGTLGSGRGCSARCNPALPL